MLTPSEIREGLLYPLAGISDPINATESVAYGFTYQFAGTSQPADLATIYSGWTALTSGEQATVRSALDYIETFLNVEFTEITGSADPDINVGKISIPGSTAGYGGYRYTYFSTGGLGSYDGFALYDNTLDLAAGQTGLILHEFGHALALKHPFAVATSGGQTHGTLPAEFENEKYSIMSYTPNPETSADPTGMMLFDIFALQTRWGANDTYNAGNTTYDGPRRGTVDVIWDAGGLDTLDARARTSAVILDLQEGAFSRWGDRDDMAVAFGTVIENATGGQGGDRLVGNAQANRLMGQGGNDTLIGGSGDDTIDGGAGTDHAHFNVASTGISGSGSVDTGFLLTSAEGTDSVIGVETFVFTDTTVTADQVRALFDSVPTGTPGNDVLRGGPGDDVLSGLAGDDRLLGEAGNDILRGGDGNDTLNGGDGEDLITGGETEADLRDVIYGGNGDDSIDGGYGNDLIYGQGGNDTMAGGFGVDELQGQDGDDVITGSAYSDLVFGGAGNDFVNGGFGSDRINGGTGADKFFHVGVAGHGSDWIQDYVAGDGDVLLFGNTAATADQFQVNFAHTASSEGEGAGDDAVQEAFVIYRPTGQILWALVDGEGQDQINLQIGAEVFDLLA